MGKQNFSTVDVAAEVACLRKRVLGMSLINVFDINSKTYVLKLGTSGEGGEKVFLLLESGVRLHTTQYERSRSSFPSNFNLKLRKHIRGRKLNDIRQLGVDRVVDFHFGQDKKSVHVVLELYAQGNIVLTDHNYEVLTLLRSHTDNEYSLLPKQPYPIQHVRISKPVASNDLEECLVRLESPKQLRGLLSRLLPFGNACIDHVIFNAGFQPSHTVSPPVDLESSEIRTMIGDLMTSIKELESWFASCSLSTQPGFILLKGDEGEGSEHYSEFEPFLLRQHYDRRHKKFDSFDAALDEFFSKREAQKMVLAEASARAAAEARLEKTKQDLRTRAETLHHQARSEELQAQLIEYNLSEVEEVILAVNSVLATGMNWDQVELLIQNEAKEGNPVAGLIDSLRLDRSTVVIKLDDLVSEEESSGRKVKISLDLSLGAAANARIHYDNMKKYSLKEQKTHEANEMAIKAAEMKVKKELNKFKPKSKLHQLRKVHWFERFYWFVTTENYLVISGKDAQQNELIVKRYMKKDDIYVHADIHGASTTVIKNYNPEMTVPPLSLHQAGMTCVCRSQAWERKVITSAWWVYADQVSKTAPTGEYLTTGSFMIRGKKNYLPPTTLTFGFGLLFKLEEASIERHLGERAPKIEELVDRSGDNETDKEDKESDWVEAETKSRSALDAFLEESQDRLPSASVSSSRQLDERDTSAATVVASGRGAPSSRRPNKQNKQKGQIAAESEKLDAVAPKDKPNRKKKGKRRDQDEEEARLMSELLQSSGPKKTRQQRRAERKQKKAEQRKQKSGERPQDVEIEEAIAKATEVPFSERLEDQNEQEIEEEEDPPEIAEEEEEEAISTDQAETVQLNSLTGIPSSDDTILFAVPVCGPYDALLPYKYKVKLLPGTLKKGKAGKQAIELLTHGKDVPQRDLTLMKAVPDSEITNVMLGSVKLSMPGLQKIKQSQKKSKKKS